MNRFLLAIAIALMTVAPSLAQCNQRPQLDQTNLNLGAVLSAQGSQGSVALNCPTCTQGAPVSASARATVQGAPAPAQPDAAAFAAEVMRKMQAQGYVMGQPSNSYQAQGYVVQGYKPLRVGSSAYAHAEVNAYATAPDPLPVVVAPSPVVSLGIPVALALPDNTAVAQASVNSSNVAGCGSGGCGGVRGFFRRNRTRARTTVVQDGQRTTTVAVANSR